MANYYYVGNHSEESAPQHIEVEFSVDAMDIEGLTFNEEDFALSGEVSSSESRSNINMGSFTVSEQVTKRMSNPTSTGILDLMNTFFRG